MPVFRLQFWATPSEAVRQLLHGATFRTCTPVALVVGALLRVVNQAEVG